MESNQQINLRFLFKLESEGPRKVIEWCMENGLVAKKMACEVCGNDMVVKPLKGCSNGCLWICRKYTNPHIRRTSVRKNSMFEGVSMDISVALLMTYMWVNDISHKFICSDLHLANQTVTDWFNFCRIICLEACASESGMIGGLGIQVEIGINKLSDLNKRKHLNGRWVVRGIEIISRKSFFRIVDYPIAIEFSTVFKQCINPGSVIVADWEQYDWCDDASFINATSSYGFTFKDLNQKVKNKYCGIWEVILGSIKKHICLGKKDLYLAEYVWKQRHAKNRFPSFLSAIRSAYLFPGENEQAEKVVIPSESEAPDVSTEDSLLGAL